MSVGLAGLTPHELRHTAAMTLDVYADLFEDDLDQVADRLDRAAGRAAADSVRTEGVGPDLDAVGPGRRQRG
ncbi:hypothetical protein ACFWDK_12950 [Micromonospora chalcea]|uniref:hypothetical protein n=1 Tax=Micromonospora sp. TSRI0369 TaxID=1703936 RepID=UPI00093CB52C|nr:hypothetical protein [Micromonospora sp. TSRI0369]OKJ36574.1 hypothetical protein AMK25_27065 [Micromonospora sp. TSRI0369]